MNTTKIKLQNKVASKFGYSMSKRQYDKLINIFLPDLTMTEKRQVIEQRSAAFISWVLKGLSIKRMGCTKKKRFMSRSEAKSHMKKINKMKGFELNGVYHCPHCEGWHMTSHFEKKAKSPVLFFLNGVKL